MSLLDCAPYGPRDEGLLLREMTDLTRRHLEGCPEYRRIWPDWRGAAELADLPWLHVGLFKHLDLRTRLEGVRFERTLTSSSTTGATPSRIALDTESSAAQARSSAAILSDYLGSQRRPLVVLDSAAALRSRGQVSARIAAALSLRPLTTETHFLLAESERADSMRWDRLLRLLADHAELLVYGFTWILWQAWADAHIPDEVRAVLAGRRIDFVHSGGWKRLEAKRVDRASFDAALLRDLGAGSRVIDFYGLVEQVGVIYPLCESGARHVPVWAGVIVRDPYTLAPLVDSPGQIQLFNTLAKGVPCHSVLTEDLGIVHSGACPCGRSGPRLELLGRVPRAELRGCANA